MRRSALLLLASLIAVSGATASPRSDGLVSKAVQALGGESALAGVKTVAVKGTIRQWEPEQSDRKSTRLNSSHSQISYAVFCLKKKKKKKKHRKNRKHNTTHTTTS